MVAWDWAAVSIDTVDPVKLVRIGRTTRVGPLTEADYLRIMEMLKTAQHSPEKSTPWVTRINYDEGTWQGSSPMPGRNGGKIASGAPGLGVQNDGLVDNLVITHEEFIRYVARNRYVESMGIMVVPEK